MNEQEAFELLKTEDPAQVEGGLRFFQQRTIDVTDDAGAGFAYGGALDFSDRAEEAIIAYGRVFDLGVERLPLDDQPKLYVQAGSTLRNLGRLAEARTLLEEGIRRFPHFRALPAFLALVEVSAGNQHTAIRLLFDALLADGSDDSSIQQYRRALAWYAGEIAQPRE